MAKTIYIQFFLACLALFSAFVVPRVKNLLAMTGYKRDWTPINIETCQSMYPEILTGCEDMHLHIDGAERILYLACVADMQDRQDWFPAMGHSNIAKAGIKDKFFAWDLNSDDLTELTSDWKGDFIAHGIDVAQTKNKGELAIYAINHLPTGSVVEKFLHKVGSSNLKHVRTFEDQTLVTTPNDLYVANESDDLFYVTNDHMFKTGLMREIETALQLPTTHLAVHSNTYGGYRTVKRALQNVNGLSGDRKGRLFMNHINAQFSVLDYEGSGNLTKFQTFKLGHACDNPSYSAETNELILSGFPAVLELAAFAKEPHVRAASSIVTRVNLDHLDASFYGGGKSNVPQPPLDEFFMDPGTGVMNMSTTAVVDKKTDSWYMSSAFNYGVVKCTGYSNTYPKVVTPAE